MQLSAETRLVLREQIATRVVDDTLAILDVNTGAYYSVNEVGALFIESARARMTLGQIADRIASEYEVSREEALQDLLELVQDLVQEGLVEVSEPEA